LPTTRISHVLEVAEIPSVNQLLLTRVMEPMMSLMYPLQLVTHMRLLSDMRAWTFPEARSS
jgi:hypothetical protein